MTPVRAAPAADRARGGGATGRPEPGPRRLRGHRRRGGVTADYDTEPERFRRGSRVTERYLTAGPSLYESLVERLLGTGARLAVDIGCGEGALSAALPSEPPLLIVGVDASATMLRAHPPPAVRADATRLPFAAGTFDAAVAANVLYHLDDPLPALREARRVLAPGGLFIAAAISRDDSPELAHVWRRPPTSFDAEEAPDLVASVFEGIEVERWDAPLLRLPDPDAVRDYLISRQVPPPEATAAASRVATPTNITKRGALITARR